MQANRERNLPIASLVLIALFVIGGAIRLYHLEQPGLLIERDFISAMIARDYYFENNPDIEEWHRDMAEVTRSYQPVHEPPITEYMVSWIYRVTGQESLAFARLLTITFWMIGGWFFYQLAFRLTSQWSAVIGTFFYLFNPLSIELSRSFQPDALMMMLYLLGLLSIWNYFQQPASRGLVFAAVISGLVILYRPLVVFSLIFAFVFLLLGRTKDWRSLFRKDAILFLGISILPALVYYGYGIFFDDYMVWKVDSSFVPRLYFHKQFWSQWLSIVFSTIGTLGIAGTLLGYSALQKKDTRVLVFALWAAYLVFGLAFAMHIHTHGYYQAQLLIIAAISLGALIPVLYELFQKLNPRWFHWLPVLVLIGVNLWVNVEKLRAEIGFQVFESEETAREIGELVQHSDKTIFLAYYYGTPLQYYGAFAGTSWPRASEYWLYAKAGAQPLSLFERLEAIGYAPDYFIVTNYNEFNRHHTDLQEFLVAYCPVMAEKAGVYTIYDGTCFQSLLAQ